MLGQQNHRQQSKWAFLAGLFDGLMKQLPRQWGLEYLRAVFGHQRKEECAAGHVGTTIISHECTIAEITGLLKQTLPILNYIRHSFTKGRI